MRRKPNTTRVAPLAVGAILSLAAAAASRATAQECQADSDCGDGYTCTTNSATVCNTCPAPYPVDAAIGFPVESVDAGSLPPALFPSADAGPGSPVGPTDPGTQPPDLPSEDAGMGFPVDPSDGGVAWIDDGGTCNSTCTSYEYHTCERKACTSDSDCPSDMVCHTETWQDCSGPMCKPDTGCDVDASFTCTEQTQSTCTERYYLPCATDEACGDGFECDKSPYTICSGGGAVMPADDGGFVVVDAG